MSIVDRYSGTDLDLELALEGQLEWHWETRMFGAEQRVDVYINPSLYAFCRCPRHH